MQKRLSLSLIILICVLGFAFSGIVVSQGDIQPSNIVVTNSDSGFGTMGVRIRALD